MGEKPTSLAQPSRRGRGVAVIFDALVRMSQLTGGRAQRSAAELRGTEGTFVYDFGADAVWTMQIRAGRIRFRRGRADSALATIHMHPVDFFDLLTGRSSYLVAQMAGKIRIEGDGHAAFILGSLIADLRANAAKPGLRGGLVRRWIDRACRKQSAIGDSR